jgi:hypothetical protein
LANTFRGEYGWRFKEYISSDLENDFYQDVKPFVNAKQWSELAVKYRSRAEALVTASDGFVASDEHLVDSTTTPLLKTCQREADDGAPVGPPSSCGRRQVGGEHGEGRHAEDATFDEKLFSRFIYEFVCLGEPCDPATFPSTGSGYTLGATHTSFIEPVFGTMRHPKFLLTEGTPQYLVNKEYMMIDKWALHNLHTRWRRRYWRRLAARSVVPSENTSRTRTLDYDRDGDVSSIFVDMGASLYSEGDGGASQEWFVGVANCQCIPFTDMMLFEAVLRMPQEVWSSAPDYLHPNYHWYNYPLSVETSSWRNPLNHLLAKLRPNDVVTVKVDFDSPGLETEIIDTILRFPELYQTIDELFYEYHVKMAYMHRYWFAANRTLNVLDSIDVFRSLRRRGIRAHSWV